MEGEERPTSIRVLVLHSESMLFERSVGLFVGTGHRQRRHREEWDGGKRREVGR